MVMAVISDNEFSVRIESAAMMNQIRETITTRTENPIATLSKYIISLKYLTLLSQSIIARPEATISPVITAGRMI